MTVESVVGGKRWLWSLGLVWGAVRVEGAGAQPALDTLAARAGAARAAHEVPAAVPAPHGASPHGASPHGASPGESSPGDDSPHESPARIAMLATGAVSAASWTQLIGMPDAWPRTWQGYGNRLSDQVGFTATEEVLRIGLERATGWHSEPRPCPDARAGRGTWSRVGASVSCGVRGAFIAQNSMGQSRPNVPLVGAIAAATALSLSWRPERKDAHKGQVFLLTRVGISLGASVVTRSVGAWRGGR